MPEAGWLDDRGAPAAAGATVDFEREGRQIGELVTNAPTQGESWDRISTPLACLRNGNGPTLLLLGGTHGDELDGPVTLTKLIAALRPADIRGRVVIVPALNRAALAAGLRGAPLDGRDLNRNFPGRPDGTLAESIAHYVDSVLLPMSDVVLDLHAGGRSVRFLRSLWLLEGADADLWRRTLDAAHAFGAPYTVVSASLGGDMSESAARRGCIYISTEAGGGATVDPDVVAMNETGICRLMAHMGLISVDAAPRSKSPTRVLQVPGSRGVLLAQDHGLFEPLVRLGDEVSAGQAIGRIHRIERPEQSPLDVISTIGGLVYGLRWRAIVRRSERLATIAIDE